MLARTLLRRASSAAPVQQARPFLPRLPFPPSPQLNPSIPQPKDTGTPVHANAAASICPPGSVLSGLGVYAGKPDPVALPDADYPVWLWSLLEPRKKSWAPEERLSRDYMRSLNADKIQANALRKRKK
ncbi:MAG: hypothetical protein SGCHY_002080 [Lobulomycetales sp.]